MPSEYSNPKEHESIDVFLRDPFFLPVSAKTYFATIDRKTIIVRYQFQWLVGDI